MILKLIEYWNDMDDIYKNTEEYTPNKKRKILIVFDYMIAVMLNPIVNELFIRGRKLNTFLAFITESYFAVTQNITLNSTQPLIMEIANKQELQQTVFNHSSDIDFKGFMNLYKKCIAKSSSFLVIDDMLVSDNLSPFQKESFRKNIKTNHEN